MVSDDTDDNDEEYLPPAKKSSQSQGRRRHSQGRPSQEETPKDVLEYLKRIMEQLPKKRDIKYQAEPKTPKEQCQLCKTYLANKNNLFRHYRTVHEDVIGPEKLHGYSVNSTVITLDNICSICGFVAANQNALDTHYKDVHGNVNSNANRAVAMNFSSSNKERISNNNQDELHECEKCGCYFKERNKLDEHMKVQHGYQLVCLICNTNLLFKDVDEHVKEVHPDVYKDNKEKNEKIITEKMMRNTKGNRVRVFARTKCDRKMVDKIEAENHARGHKKGFKTKVSPRVKEVAPRVKVSKGEDNITDVTSNDHVIFTCDVCDISTGSYDAAVEHAQRHQTNNLNDIVTKQCQICELKLDTLCSKDHDDLHYKNKEIHKESFRYFKYKPQVLLYEDCFGKEPELEKYIDESVYKHTRTVRMRVMPEVKYNLYKCCQCDNFVEPAAVLNHAINYDTCVKVKCSYTCNICERKFNNRLARNNHAKDHKSEGNYKTVLFNHDNDKEFNKILREQSQIVIKNITSEKNNADVIDNEAETERLNTTKNQDASPCGDVQHGDAEPVAGSSKEAENGNRSASGVTEVGENEQLESDGKKYSPSKTRKRYRRR